MNTIFGRVDDSRKRNSNRWTQLPRELDRKKVRYRSYSLLGTS